MCRETLQWRHNGRDSVSNHQPHDCLLNRLSRRRSKKTSKLCVTGLCAGNSPGTGEFPAQMASNAENVSIWWRHHGTWNAPSYSSHPASVPLFLVAGFGRQPLYDEIGAAARNIHCYTVIGFWQWLAVGLIVPIETLLAIVRHRIFILILGEYRLGLLGIEMYHGFERLLNPTDSSFAHL